MIRVNPRYLIDDADIREMMKEWIFELRELKREFNENIYCEYLDL